MTSVSELKRKAANRPPIDDNVQLPAAIRAAAARSEQLHKAAYEGDTPPQPEEPPKEPQQPQEQSQEPNEDGSKEGKSQEPKPQEPAPAQAGQGDTPPAPAQSGDNKGRNWENDYNAMKGRHDKLKEETIPELNNRIRHLESLLASAATAPKQQEPQQRPPSELQFGKVTDKDREDFGEEFLDAARRAAEEKLGPYIQQLEQQVRQLGGSVQTAASMSAKSAKEALYRTLDTQLPNWRQVNRDQGFIAWTNMRDPFSGQPRIKLLQEAFDNNDTDRVLHFFRSFLTDEATTAPAPGYQTETPPAQQPGKVPLETFAAPGRAKAPAAQTPPGEKETISRAQISQFYLDVQKGKYRGNEAEKNRLEQMIFDAERDGRIID